jgi:DUF1680 family protein
MSKKRLQIVVWMLIGAVAVSTAQNKSLVNTSQSPYAKLIGVNMGDVHWTKGFWADRFEVCRNSMSPKLLKTYMDPKLGHAIQNFQIAAGQDTGRFVGPSFQDGDFYKEFESLVSLYAQTGDKKLDQLMDEIIPVIVKAQRADGYIHTPTIIAQKNNPKEAGAFADRLNFETYNMGHLMTAACLHYRVTGKRTLLDAAIKAADFLYGFYKKASPELARNAICPSHYMGVVEMYRTTRDPKYLELSKSLIDIRGMMKEGTDDNQDRVPFRQQTKAMGHAVRANYLYAGVADVFAETGDTTLLRPLNMIWNNMVDTKMYITGGCGALYDGVSPYGTSYNPVEIQKTHQSFGRDYQLPNMTAYNETCANIGNLLFNWRMLQITGEAKYADVVELVLYNSLLSGVSLDGVDFCYTNPLSQSTNFPYKMRWMGGRIPYIALSNCCPPNTTRTVSEVQDYAYNLSKEGLWVNLYGGNEINTTLENGEKIQVAQTTDYPWEGAVSIEMKKAPKKQFALFVRIPGWCRGASLTVNGKEEQTNLASSSYVKLERKWKPGDKVELNLPMEAKLMEANPLVEESRNQVAVKRGPVVYCMEGVDLPGSNIFGVTLPSDIKFVPKPIEIDGAKLAALEGKAFVENTGDWSNTLYREVSPLKKEVAVRLIPYFAWGNRGQGDMTVWMNLLRK